RWSDPDPRRALRGDRRPRPQAAGRGGAGPGAAGDRRPRSGPPPPLVRARLRPRARWAVRHRARAAPRRGGGGLRRLHLEAPAPRCRPQPPPDRGGAPGAAPAADRGRSLMARILAYTSPARGHLFPMVPILDELRSRGHDIALRTLSSEVEAMRERGFEAAPIDPETERAGHDDYVARSQLGALKRVLRTFARRAQREAPELRRAIAELAPDAVIVDCNTWGAQAVAERWGGPWATWCPYPLPLRGREVPPFGPGLRPARGPAGRLRDALLRPLILGSYDRALLPRLNEVRRTVVFLNDAAATETFTRPPLVLYMTAEPFEYPRSAWPPNIVLVGPCAWEPPAEEPAWLAEAGRPIVLVTTSSEYQDDGRLAHAALQGL